MLIQRVRSRSDCEHQTSEAYVKAVITTYTTDFRKLDKPEAVILDGTLTSIYLLLTSAKQRSQRVTLLTLTFRSIGKLKFPVYQICMFGLGANWREPA